MDDTLTHEPLRAHLHEGELTPGDDVAVPLAVSGTYRPRAARSRTSGRAAEPG